MYDVYQKVTMLFRTSRGGVTPIPWVIACAKWKLLTGRH